MGINQLINNSSGTDWGEYELFNRTISVDTKATIGTSYTALEVQGEGFISRIITSTPNTVFRIIVDGEIIYRGSSTGGSSSVIGVFETNLIIGANADGFILTLGSGNRASIVNGVRDLPSNETTATAAVLPKPLFFNRSLLVEIETTSTTFNPVKTVLFTGGIKL